MVEKMPRVVFTGARAERFEELKVLRRYIGNDEYAKEKARLIKAEGVARQKAAAAAKRAEEREMAREAAIEAARRRKAEERRVAKEAARVAYNAARREKRAASRQAVVDIRSNRITDSDEFQIEIRSKIIEKLAPLIGETHAYLQVSQNGTIVVSELIRITGKSVDSIFWDNIWPYIHNYSGGTTHNIFEHHWGEDFGQLDENDTVRFVILKAKSIPSQYIKQSFRDGIEHCVLNQLYILWKEMEENSESDASRKRCRQIARRIKSLESVYPAGIPEDEMDKVAKIAHRCIVIHDIIGNEVLRYNKNSSKIFHFTNTRKDHVEPGYITMDKKYTAVTQEEIDEKLNTHDAEDIFYLFNGDVKTKKAQSIRSATGAWAVYNEDHELFSEFSEFYGIRNYGIDAVKFSDLNAFLKEARIINSAPTPLCDRPNDIDDVNHIDIEKAYTQHNYCKYYKGFLGHIQQWRKLPDTIDAVEFLDSHIGIFQFVVKSNTNELLTKLGIAAGKMYTLPSPEILYFIKECGLAVNLTAGAWGSSFDMEYDDEMLKNRRYCTWAGKLGMDRDIDVYTFKGDYAWASHLKYTLGEDRVMYFEAQGMIVVKVPKKSYFTTHHILAFITSYTRINMLDIMSKIKGELVKVVLDGIYFRGEIPDVKIPHKDNKEKIKHIGFRDAWYYASEIDTSAWANYNKDLDGSCVLAGAGGTGKSFSVLTDKGFVNPLYVVPSHLLGRKCREKYGCSYTTINKLIGEECRSFKDTHREPGVIFIDELTMIDKAWIERAIKMHPNSLIFIAGDIDEKQWYQCRNGHPGNFSKIWIPGTEWRYVYYTRDMRSKDEELKQFKTKIREVMKSAFTDGNQGNATQINYYVKKNYKTVKFEDAVKMFQAGDYWIAGTHKTNEKLLENGVVSGYINKNKEIVQADEPGAIKRGSFTTHSFQGLTIEKERVFISLDFFEYAMLYTSISRVCNFNQIVLVN